MLGAGAGHGAQQRRGVRVAGAGAAVLVQTHDAQRARYQVHVRAVVLV